MLIRLFIATLVALVILVSGYYYIYQTIFEPILGNGSSVWLVIFIALCSLTVLGFLLIRILPQIIRRFVELIMFTWMGCSFIFFILCILTVPLKIVISYFNYSQKIFSLCLFSGGIILIIYCMFQALRKPKIILASIPLSSSVPRQVENLIVVVLSDIHVSGLIGRRKMLQLTERVNQLNPDFIFLTGDLMDGSLKQLHKEIEPLRHLKAKEDIIYITGNHEYYSGPLAWKKHFETDFKWNVLSNSSKTIQWQGVSLNILGIEDKHWLAYEKIPKKQDQRLNTSVEHLRQGRSLIEKSPPFENCLNILLAHQPKDAKYLKTYPWINLQISGHTHGGQIWPLKYLVKKDQKYTAGLYKIKENQYIYVNQGTGFWGPPMRLGSIGEITLMKFVVEHIHQSSH